jgi:2-dehydro-3-deoxygalactonokinase
MHWSEGFIAVDWGTTNRRAWRIGAGGGVEAEFADECGILGVQAGGFPEAVAALRAHLGDLPQLMAGMIGSNRGWIEAPYVPCPADAADLAMALQWAEPGRVAIVPGVRFDADGQADVMRGEEVQVLGALAAGEIGPDCIVCHPGTHTKWVRLSGGRIVAFRTVMTGELFNLLKAHSILADLVSGTAARGSAFTAGVRHGLDHDDLNAELFAIRARVLLGKSEREDAAGYASGLLIGTDVRFGLGFAGDADIVAMGRPDLTGLFAEALRISGRSPREVDGELAFLAGVKHLVELAR